MPPKGASASSSTSRRDAASPKRQPQPLPTTTSPTSGSAGPSRRAPHTPRDVTPLGSAAASPRRAEPLTALSPTAGSSGSAHSAQDAFDASGHSGRGAFAHDPMISIPSDEQVMRAEHLQNIAEQLSRSLLILRTKLAVMEQRISKSAAVEASISVTSPAASATRASPAAVPLLPFQIRRAQREKEQLQEEVDETSRAIKRLLIMSQQLDGIMGLRQVIFAETKAELEAEIASLEAERASSLEAIREGYISRINLLHRYWPWRQLFDLGDTSVGATFQEELQRGPRLRNVGIQNNIQSDYIETQLRWLEAFSAREDTFRGHLKRLDALVEDLNDINDLLESTLTCQVCGMLFEDPVIFWPCGHTFCLPCFESLMIAPSLFRCPICGSIGSEGYVHNLLIAESVAKWMFKSAGYGDVQGPLNSIRVHLTRFRKDRMEERIAGLQALLKAHKAAEAMRGDADSKAITISYRAF